MFAVFSISRVFWFNLSYPEVLQSPEFVDFLVHREFYKVIFYSIGVISLVIFTYQITRKIGQDFLINMITGKYYHPKRNRKIFLFISISRTEKIPRHMSPLNYYHLINDVIYDITPAILTFNGKIYHYVENEIVVYWQPEKGINNAACVRAYFAICDCLYDRKEYYARTYQLVPKVHASMHLGDVVQGEIGHGKTEIDFYGDVLNTTSRILNKTTEEHPFLVSSQLLTAVALPDIWEEEYIGDIPLDGKSQPMSLHALRDRNISHNP